MTHVDVVVVGGGIAGTSVAYFLADRCSVVVLEQESVLGHHSTGRSAAVFTECYGEPVVRRLAISSRPFLAAPPDGFAAAPLLAPRGIAFVADAAQAGRLDESVDAQRALVPSVRRLDAAEAVDLCPVLDPEVITGAVLEPEAMDLDVAALHDGYRRGIVARGGVIRASWKLVGADRAEGRWALTGSDGERISCDTLVVAAGAWCDVVGELAGARPLGLTPKRRTAFTFAAPEGHRSWPMVIDLDERFYFKPEGAALLASPADAMPMEPHDVRHREVDVALGIERIEHATTLSIRSVQTAWAGLRSFVADSRPVNGWDDQVPGLYWLAGQGGFGIKTSPAMGRYAAGMIVDGVVPDELSQAGLVPDELGVERLRG